MWGGKHSIIIPTDGSRVDSVFWELLEAFDPDYICEYHKTGLDLKIGSPSRYEDWLQSNLKQESGDQAAQAGSREALDQALSGVFLPTIGITPELRQELKTRLAPFFHEDHVVEYSFSARSEPDYPFTKLSVILPYCEHPDQLLAADGSIEGIPPLWVDSVLGATYQEQEERIQACGLAIEHRTLSLAEVYQLMAAQLAIKDVFPRDYLAKSPFELGMAALTQYRSPSERDWEMPAVVVVGWTPARFRLVLWFFADAPEGLLASCQLGWRHSKRLPYGSRMAANEFKPQNNTQFSSL